MTPLIGSNDAIDCLPHQVPPPARGSGDRQAPLQAANHARSQAHRRDSDGHRPCRGEICRGEITGTRWRRGRACGACDGRPRRRRARAAHVPGGGASFKGEPCRGGAPAGGRGSEAPDRRSFLSRSVRVARRITSCVYPPSPMMPSLSEHALEMMPRYYAPPEPPTRSQFGRFGAPS